MLSKEYQDRVQASSMPDNQKRVLLAIAKCLVCDPKSCTPLCSQHREMYFKDWK